jgi:hypothetical protein
MTSWCGGDQMKNSGNDLALLRVYESFIATVNVVHMMMRIMMLVTK